MKYRIIALVLIFLLSLSTGFSLKALNQEFPDIYISEKYTAKVVLLNNKTHPMDIVEEEVSINGSGISLYPSVYNPSSLGAGEDAEFYIKGARVNETEGKRKITYNVTTNEGWKVVEVAVSVKNPLQLVPEKEVSGTKLTAFNNPYYFPFLVENKGKETYEHNFDLDFPEGKFMVKTHSPKGELSVEELESQNFSVGAESASLFQIEILPTITGKHGTLNLTVFRQGYPNTKDFLTLRIHTITRIGNFVKFSSAPGLALLSVFLLPVLAAVLWGMRFFQF